MEAKKRYLGKKIQISNSKIGMQLSQKIDPRFGIDYESVFTTGHSILESLARKTNSDVEKTDFLSNVYSLGKIAGGDSTLNYVNARISPERSKINEKDIMLQNLKSVFPDLEQRFTEKELVEFVQLYIENSELKEANIVRMAYDLNLLLQYYKSTGNYKNSDVVKFIFQTTNNIINKYNKDGILEFDENTKRDVSSLKARKVEFDTDEQEHLNSYVTNYNNSGEKDKLIEDLNGFRIKLEKKTKIR